MNDSDLYKQILQKLVEKDKNSGDIARAEREAEAVLQSKLLKNETAKQYLNLQKDWSKFICWMLVGSSVAVFLMIFLLGLECLNFEKYPYFPHTVVGSFFAQFIGLGLIVAKYLFPRKL